jgi:hypothetical protein
MNWANGAAPTGLRSDRPSTLVGRFDVVAWEVLVRACVVVVGWTVVVVGWTVVVVVRLEVVVSIEGPGWLVAELTGPDGRRTSPAVRVTNAPPTAPTTTAATRRTTSHWLLVSRHDERPGLLTAVYVLLGWLAPSSRYGALEGLRSVAVMTGSPGSTSRGQATRAWTPRELVALIADEPPDSRRRRSPLRPGRVSTKSPVARHPGPLAAGRREPSSPPGLPLGARGGSARTVAGRW